MNVVEAHREPSAFGDEFLERGALLGNARGNDAGECNAQSTEQQYTKRDQQRASHPMRAAFVPPLFKGCFGHLTSSGQHHVVLIEAVERFHL